MQIRHWLITGLLVLATGLLLVTAPAAPGYSKPQLAPRPAAAPRIIHPCSGIIPEPPFAGVSPLSITWVPGLCTSDVYQAGYGDITVWQAGGHNYVGIAGFAQRAFYIFNVDDPYQPVLLANQIFPSGGTASLAIFAFRQAGHRYLSIAMRGSSPGCGFFVYNVDDPANPTSVGRKQGTDWCTVHEHFISTDANGDADYAWLTMSAESGSGIKIVVLDIRNLPTMTETGRYQRPDGAGFAHDVTVAGNRVFIAHWDGGLIIQDKETLAHNTNPTPLNPIDSIRPSNFSVHHAWPTSDGNHVFIEDEFQNSSSLEKIKLYNIANVAAPYYETGIIGPDVAASNRAHNMKIIPQSPGHDLLLDGWYEAGTRGFNVDTTVSPPAITQVLSHRLLQSPNGQFGDVWGVDYLPCTLHGQPYTCLYSSDMFFGLVADALGTDPSLDPYPPTSAITDPVAGQTITTCSYTVQGTAHDYWSGLAGVELSTDNGATWLPTTGAAAWTFPWTPPGDGAYTLRVRATDLAGNVEVPAAGIAVTVAGGCSAASPTPPAPTATPPAPTATPPAATATGTPPLPTNPPATSTPAATNPPATSTPPAPSATALPPSPAASSTALPPSPAATSTPPAPTATSTACAAGFSDVAGEYFAPAVTYLACHDVLSGYADGTFRPYNATTRGQVVKIVVGAFGVPAYTPATPTFGDVPAGHPFYAPIEAAAHAGIVAGYADGTFAPSAPVTRGQLAKIVTAAAAWPLRTPAGPSFTDVPPGSAFYSYVETAACHGLVSGYTCGAPGEPCDAQGRSYFRPATGAVRGQLAKIIYNALTSPAACSP